MSSTKYNSGYDAFDKLCREKNVTPYKVSKETGIGRSTLSDWKNGKTTPKIEKLEKIAKYFGVPVDVFKPSLVVSISRKILPKLTREEDEITRIIEAYRKSSAETQRIIKRILGIEDDYLMPIAAHAHDDATAEDLTSDIAMLREAAMEKK